MFFFWYECVCVNHQSAQKYSEIIDISKLSSIMVWYWLAFVALFDGEYTGNEFLTQFIRSNGIDCTKYSRCSLDIKHIGRFFCVISSSRSFSDCNNCGNQIRSQEQINWLSNECRKKREKKIQLKCVIHFFGVFFFVSDEYEWKKRTSSMQVQLGNSTHFLYYSPTMSTTRKVSRIGSITSPGIFVNLLFWMFNVSSEFRFSNDDCGNTSILDTEKKNNSCVSGDVTLSFIFIF